jgi:Spondin_N
VEKISIETRPLDCGVSSGLTFSAPVWPTSPLDPVQRITPSFPKHQASSFFYEDKQNLPPIAYYRLHKIKEYVGVKEKSVKRIHQKYRRQAWAMMS